MRAALLASCALAALAALAPSAPALADGQYASPSSDACLAVANAKVLEWNQAKLYRTRMDTMADGKARPSVMIFTENGMFEQVRGLWRTGQALRNQRVAGSTESVMKRMGLTDCASAGEDDVDGQKASVYTYSQDPDIRARIWISNGTGLPLRAEIEQSPGHDNNPVKVSMTYAYNDDVHVPNAAVQRNLIRMQRSQDWLRDQSSTSPAVSH